MIGFSQASTQGSTVESNVPNDGNIGINGSRLLEESVHSPTKNVSKWEHWRGRKDLRAIISDGTMDNGPKPRKRFDDESLCETVRFILCSNNVQLLYWGVRGIYTCG